MLLHVLGPTQGLRRLHDKIPTVMTRLTVFRTVLAMSGILACGVTAVASVTPIPAKVTWTYEDQVTGK